MKTAVLTQCLYSKTYHYAANSGKIYFLEVKVGCYVSNNKAGPIQFAPGGKGQYDAPFHLPGLRFELLRSTG